MQMPHALIPEVDGGLGWDVWIDPAFDRYFAKTILRIVKLVNRRGMVRYIATYRGAWYRFVKETNRIAGLDDRMEWIADHLDDSTLYVSFSDRLEAQKFVADMNSLAASVSLAASESDDAASLARQAHAQLHVRTDYPERLTFRHKDGWERSGYGWLVMVYPQLRDPAKVEVWMRKRLESRYWPAVWQPGSTPQFCRKSYRYWHLKAEQWQLLFDQSRETDGLLIVHFHMKTDLEAFDRAYGPSSLL